MCAFLLRSHDGEEEASGGASVVERGCENLNSSGESETLGASGGEEAASDPERGRTEGDGTRCEISLDQSEAAVVHRAQSGNLIAAGIAAPNICANFGSMLDAALRARMIDSLSNATSSVAMSCAFD
jgi:hypothetical protein